MSKVMALDTLVEVAPSKCQWLVVENHSPDTIHVKKGVEIAEVSFLEDIYDVPEELVKQEEERRKGEEIIQANAIESEIKASPLTTEECWEKLRSSLSYANPNLTEEEKIRTTELLLKNHSSFSLDPGELGRVCDIKVEIEMGDTRPIHQLP